MFWRMGLEISSVSRLKLFCRVREGFAVVPGEELGLVLALALSSDEVELRIEWKAAARRERAEVLPNPGNLLPLGLAVDIGGGGG
jgi:hypothetical protein